MGTKIYSFWEGGRHKLLTSTVCNQGINRGKIPGIGRSKPCSRNVILEKLGYNFKLCVKIFSDSELGLYNFMDQGSITLQFLVPLHWNEN
jgi:hypothetical protein